MMAWDLDPNLYLSPYRALLKGLRARLHRERKAPPVTAGCRC